MVDESWAVLTDEGDGLGLTDADEPLLVASFREVDTTTHTSPGVTTKSSSSRLQPSTNNRYANITPQMASEARLREGKSRTDASDNLLFGSDDLQLLNDSTPFSEDDFVDIPDGSNLMPDMDKFGGAHWASEQALITPAHTFAASLEAIQEPLPTAPTPTIDPSSLRTVPSGPVPDNVIPDDPIAAEQPSHFLSGTALSPRTFSQWDDAHRELQQFLAELAANVAAQFAQPVSPLNFEQGFGDAIQHAGSSGRRKRPRSPSPAYDLGFAMAQSTFCFRPDESGILEDVSNEVRKKARRSPKDVSPPRVKTKKKTCLRCYLFKEKCDGGNPCGNCLSVKGKARFYKSPCEHIKIEEAICFRAGNSKFNQLRAEPVMPLQWSSDSAPIKIKIIRPRAAGKRWPQGETYPTLTLEVNHFADQPGELTTESWNSNGQEVVLRLPTYASRNHKATTKALEHWVEQNFDLYTKDMSSQDGHYLTSATFDQAVRWAQSNPTSIVRESLKIWIGSRMAQEFFCMMPGNELNVQPVDDLNSIHHGQCPVPPILDNQLDALMIIRMLQWQSDILGRVKKMIRDRKRNSWFEIFLTIFVLLTNLQYVYNSQIRWWTMHFNTGADNCTGQAYRSISYKFMKEYEISAGNLIAHFRFAYKGSVPFSLDWSRTSVQQMGEIDAGAVDYVKYVSGMVRNRKDDFLQIVQRTKSGEFGDMAWTAFLFVDPDDEAEPEA